MITLIIYIVVKMNKFIFILFFSVKLKNLNLIIYIYQLKNIYGDWGLGIGDWGLGIGDWAQSPIPNPQSPIPNPQLYIIIIIIL